MISTEIYELAEKRARAYFVKFGKDERADAGLFKLIIGLFIISILISALLPTAISNMFAVETTTTVNNTTVALWDAGTVAVWDSLPIMIVVVVVAVLAGLAYRAFSD